MKLVIAIVNNDDVKEISEALAMSGFSSTIHSSRGGFLNNDNSTILVGVDEEKARGVMDVIQVHAHRRQVEPCGALAEACCPGAGPITVGGATIFVVDVEQFERV